MITDGRCIPSSLSSKINPNLHSKFIVFIARSIKVYMAYYDDVFMWAQEHTTLFPVAEQDPVSFSNYAYDGSLFHESKSMGHGDYGYEYDYNYDHDNGYGYGDCHNWYSSPNPVINYSGHNFVDPKLIVYEPVECDTGYVSYHTQYSISCSKADSGFNEPEFDEYDPTPYGGGYDIISVYGKPLPPSDKTCYPHSKSKLIEPRPIPDLIGPRPMPNLESQTETKARPHPQPIHIATPTPLVEPKPDPEPIHAMVPESGALDLKEVGETENEEYSYPGYAYDYPWPEYENANASRVGYDYGYGKQVVQIPPYEYSPEVVDLCESIFGHWPCLARIRKQQMGVENNPQMRSIPEIGYNNPLEECASYFFGRPITSYNA